VVLNALVCQSGVCDTKDDKCGYANGDGPCLSSNGGTVCRSGLWIALAGLTVLRSMICSTVIPRFSSFDMVVAIGYT